MTIRVTAIAGIIAIAALLAVTAAAPWQTHGQSVSPTETPSATPTVQPTPSPAPQPTGLTNTGPDGRTCTGDARIRIDKTGGADETGTVLEVIAVGPGVQVTVGETVIDVPPGPFPPEAQVLVTRNDDGVLFLGIRSCEGGLANGLPSTGGPPR